MFDISSILIRGGVLIVLILLLWIVEHNENFIDAKIIESKNSSIL